MVFAWLSDKLRQRAIFIAAQTMFTIVGLLLVAYAHRGSVRYFGVSAVLSLATRADSHPIVGIFVANAGALGCIPAVIAYVSEVLRLSLLVQ